MKSLDKKTYQAMIAFFDEYKPCSNQATKKDSRKVVLAGRILLHILLEKGLNPELDWEKEIPSIADLSQHIIDRYEDEINWDNVLSKDKDVIRYGLKEFGKLPEQLSLPI